MNDQAKKDFLRYVTGALLSAGLTALAFWAVLGADWPRGTTLWVIGAAAVAQIAVQLRFFLHIGWNQKRDDLQLILFSIVLLGMMMGGTLWIMSSLAMRM